MGEWLSASGAGPQAGDLSDVESCKALEGGLDRDACYQGKREDIHGERGREMTWIEQVPVDGVGVARRSAVSTIYRLLCAG